MNPIQKRNLFQIFDLKIVLLIGNEHYKIFIFSHYFFLSE